MPSTDTVAQRTRDHNEIRKWAEARGGKPSKVKTSQNGGILRIDFREPDEGLEEISWEEFFTIFDENKLEFLFQDTTADGQKSRFNKFVGRDGDVTLMGNTAFYSSSRKSYDNEIRYLADCETAWRTDKSTILN